MMHMVLKSGASILKAMEKDRARVRKAMGTALKREGFLLSKELTGDILKGAPGGQAYSKLSSIASKSSSFPSRKPFTRLLGKRGRTHGYPLPGKGVIPIRYNPVMKGGQMRVDVGMVDTKQEKISKSWKWIFARQQEGFRENIPPSKRGNLAWIGANFFKKGSRLRKHFFLRKGTTSFRTPARPVIDPFFSKWRYLSSQRIKSNFERKLRGERI